MPSKISQIELNGVTYDVRDADAVKLANIGEVDEIVVLSTVDKEVVASGTTLAEIFDRIDTATIVENVQDGEWIVNIVNSDLTVDLANYYSKSKVDELIANAMNSVVSYLTPAEQAVLASGITVAKVTNYDSHLADTDRHLGVGERATLVKISDLSDYYTKSDTYSKTEVNSLVSEIPKFDIKVVQALPTTDISTSTIYLLRNEGSSQNMYDEYIYVDGAWEKLGSQMVSNIIDVQDESGNSLVNQNSVAVIPGSAEIIPSSVGRRTGEEYYDLYLSGKRLMFRNSEVAFAEFNSNTKAVTFYYVDNSLLEFGYKGYLSFTVYQNKSIGENLTTLGTIHKHINMEVLDKFDEDNGTPTYDGNPIGGGNVDDVVDENDVSLVDANKIAHIPNSNIDDDIVDVCAMLEGADVFTVGDDYLGVDSNTTLVF